MRIAVVGAGVAGLSCADQLSRYGIGVTLFDKGKRPGGRASTLVLDEGNWDFGAQYFTSRSSDFAEQVSRWIASGNAAYWPSAGRDAVVGVPTMAALLAAQACNHDARFNTQIKAIGRVGTQWHLIGPDITEGPYDGVVIAVPAEQAATLIGLHDLNMAKEAATVRSVPCWTLMVGFHERLDGVEDVLRPNGPIAWAARNNSKPGRPLNECWVLQAEAGWSARNLERDAAEIAADLLHAFAKVVGTSLPAPTFLKAHRWRFALPRGGNGAAIWNATLRLGACGDWCSGPRIEAAWLSGRDLAARITESLVSAEATAAA